VCRFGLGVNLVRGLKSLQIYEMFALVRDGQGIVHLCSREVLDMRLWTGSVYVVNFTTSWWWMISLKPEDFSAEKLEGKNI